tara:strand:+ start:7773 stop:7958 length:186 start_codon:yes stop_codon:yes gene_type:complete
MENCDMGRLKDYLLFLEEKGIAVWNEAREEYDYLRNPYANDLLTEYAEKNVSKKPETEKNA